MDVRLREFLEQTRWDGGWTTRMDMVDGMGSGSCMGRQFDGWVVGEETDGPCFSFELGALALWGARFCDHTRRLLG